MAPGTASQSIVIDAPVGIIYATAHDFESFSSWQASVRSARVLEWDAQRRGRLVELVIDAKLRRLRSLLEYRYRPLEVISWEQVAGDVASIAGDYTFEPHSQSQTRVTYRLTSDLGLPVPGAVARRVAGALMQASLADLKRQAEQVHTL